jgi:hypothetical protein
MIGRAIGALFHLATHVARKKIIAIHLSIKILFKIMSAPGSRPLLSFSIGPDHTSMDTKVTQYKDFFTMK